MIIRIIFNLSPFHISMNYVYGSGLPNTILHFLDNERPYSRFDIAFLYQFEKGWPDIQTGISLLNVFDTENIRYNDFIGFPNQKQSYPYATSFTPTIFLNISIINNIKNNDQDLIKFFFYGHKKNN